MKLSDLRIRDPFILPVDGVYYLYGRRYAENSDGPFRQGILVWKSTDLENWEAPVSVLEKGWDGLLDESPEEGEYFWAPEVHAYRGAYYLFTTFLAAGEQRGCRIFKADSPEGPFRPHSDGTVTPPDWMCLDGTLFIENGTPYMVFCHEWLQIEDGTICVMPLTDDLKAPAGEPITLFSAGGAPWGIGMNGDGRHFVTDGPFLHRAQNGVLQMLWSSFGQKGYFEVISVSESGSVLGPWRHERLLFEEDGGHGMLFRTNEGELRFVLHSPNAFPLERPVIFPVTEDENGLLQSV